MTTDNSINCSSCWIPLVIVAIIAIILFFVVCYLWARPAAVVSTAPPVVQVAPPVVVPTAVAPQTAAIPVVQAQHS